MRVRLLTASLFLLLLNLWIARELLTIEYVNQMGSIEGTHIAIGRWALENWRDLTWFPLWYGGIPYQNAYSPLLPLVVAMAAGAGAIPAPLAYHAVTAVLYSLGPVTLFWLAVRLSGSLAYSFAAALLYSLTSPSAFLLPGVRTGLGGLWHARRLQALVQFGEGPHIASMTLLPVALLLLVVAFEKRRPVWWILAALGLASVVMTNWLGGAAMAAAVCAFLLARQEGKWRKNWLAAFALGIYAYAIVSCWIPPSTVLNVRAHEEFVSGALAPMRWLHAAAALLAVVILLWGLRRLKAPEHLRFSLLFLFPVALVTLSAERLGVFLVPQGKRYHLEMEMALALAAVFAAKIFLDRLPRRSRIAIAGTLLVLSVYPAARYRNYSRHLIRPIDIDKTIEYREAQWFDRNIKPHRVFAPGSVAFFLNVFTNTPQYAGGYDQGAINPVFPAVHYQVLSGDNAGAQEGNVAVLWLRALGVDAVSVSGPGSAEAFHPFRNPGKFEGILPVLWRDGDDAIYRVPHRSGSLAHVIRTSDLPSRRLRDGLDVEPVRTYVAALESPAYPLADMTWRNNHAAVISTRMEKEQILSVQISYHPGWHATVNGQPRRVYGDHLGQLVIEPGCQGPCEVEIAYDGGLEMRLARLISWAALLAGLGWIVIGRRKKTGLPAK